MIIVCFDIVIVHNCMFDNVMFDNDSDGNYMFDNVVCNNGMVDDCIFDNSSVVFWYNHSADNVVCDKCSFVNVVV